MPTVTPTAAIGWVDDLDDEIIDAEFEAIIAAEWPRPLRHKSVRRPRLLVEARRSRKGLGAVDRHRPLRFDDRRTGGAGFGQPRSPPPGRDSAAEK